MENNYFNVSQINFAKYMMKNECECIGCTVDEKGYITYRFERNEKTIETYKKARMNMER